MSFTSAVICNKWTPRQMQHAQCAIRRYTSHFAALYWM